MLRALYPIQGNNFNNFNTLSDSPIIIDPNTILDSTVPSNDESESIWYQSLLDNFIDILSQKDYDTFNQDIEIDGIIFKHFSHQFMYHVLLNNSVLLVGDSIVHKLFQFMISGVNDYDLYTNHHNRHPLILETIEHNSFNQSLTIFKKRSVIMAEYMHIFHDSERIHWKNFMNSGQTQHKEISATFDYYTFFDDQIVLAYLKHFIVSNSQTICDAVSGYYYNYKYKCW